MTGELKLPTQVEIRQAFSALVLKDLLGPASTAIGGGISLEYSSCWAAPADHPIPTPR